jgi:hypothetical protein
VFAVEFFTSFKAKFPNIPIMLTILQALKPWFVRWLQDWNTYYCRYHMELRELLNRFNDMNTQGKGIHDTYSCKCTKVCDV